MRACRFSSVMSGSAPLKAADRISSKALIGGSIGSSIQSAPRFSAIARASPRVPSDE